MTHTSIRRRGRLMAGLAAATAAVLALAGCASGSSTAAGGSDETPEVTYQLGWLPTVEWGANWIADSEGYYEDEGIDFNWLPGGPNVASDTVVASGKATIGSASADAIAAAVSEGAPLKIIAAAFKKSPFSIVSLADSPIETPEDMIGKKIGVAAANQTQFDLFLAINDIDPADVTVVPVQFDPSPVANGEVDGQVVYAINEPTQLEVQGISTYTMLMADFGFEVLTDVFFTTDQQIEENPEALAAFLRATAKGYLASFEDPELAADLTVDEYGKDQGLDREQQVLEAQRIEELVLPEGSGDALVMTEEEMQASVDTIAKMGVEVTVDELFDTSIQDLL